VKEGTHLARQVRRMKAPNLTKNRMVVKRRTTAASIVVAADERTDIPIITSPSCIFPYRVGSGLSR
jgi:hypothetical protein